MNNPTNPESQTAGLRGRIFYAVAELARVGNVPVYRLVRLLRSNGVTLLHSGRALYVPLDEIQRKIPPLWKSIRIMEALRRGAVGETASSAMRHRVHRAP